MWAELEDVDDIGVGFWGLAPVEFGCGAGCWIAAVWFIAENVAAEDPTPKWSKSPAIELFEIPTIAFAAVAENMPLTLELLCARDPELLLNDGGPSWMIAEWLILRTDFYAYFMLFNLYFENC